ncbi:MAG: putative methyltransferase [Bacteroidetes bacterium ADurb.Bin174]|nr:MAG: putative methyltransferase [Bacteroidetes bacterium ADurb.Bin174]
MDYKKDLAEKLPQLKEIDGFPKGSDEDIIALSQPPYYTACPNPYIKEFIEKLGKPYNEDTDNYFREPFISDVSEGKNDAVYNAHSYHTKIPYKAIHQYIDHFTSENDIVLDGFSGTGSTGFSAASLNRHCILNDLGPSASLISFGYNKPKTSSIDLKQEFDRIYREVENEVNWMFQTDYGTKKGVIQNTILSDVFICKFCETEYVFSDYAVDFTEKTIKSKYKCKGCNADISKADSETSFEDMFDNTINSNIKIAKKAIVVIQGTIGTKRFEKKADESDLKLLEKIENLSIPYWYPSDRMPEGDESRRNDSSGYTHVHHFFTKRNLYALACIYDKIIKSKFSSDLLYVFQSCIQRATITNRFRFGGTGGLSGTLYIPSLIIERAILPLFKNKFRDYLKMNECKKWKQDQVLVTNQSVTDLSNLPPNSIDYIFTDPPFGDNLMYSELSFWWEAWLKVYTNTDKEGIINKTQNKRLVEYNSIMLASFKEYYRVLKPKRWITVVFHNSKSSVWNGIQEAITKAGFLISQVSTLDKKQGSFKQVTAPGAVANDLVISAFKPRESFVDSFLKQAGENLEASFVQEFLSNLPAKPIIERTEKMLYSKMVAYYIQRGYEIRYDAKSFYSLLNQNFAQEDGFWFTANQINSYLEYKKRMKLDGIDEVKAGGMFLFVTDEKSAIVWLFNFLSEPKSFSDVSVAFNQLANIQGDAVPELREMLEQNFVFEDGKYRRPKSEPEHNQIAEKREKALMREFESLLIQAKTDKKKIKEVRKEALVYGFEVCYKDKRFKDIMAIAQKLDKSILENSGELSDFVEAAEIQLEGIS